MRADQLIILPDSAANSLLAVQSLDGSPMITTVPYNSYVSTTFNSPQITENDKGTCTGVAMQKEHSMNVVDAILSCFAHAVHNLKVQAAEDAISEYNSWSANRTILSRPPDSRTPHPSGRSTAASDVRMFGLADAINAFIGNDPGRAIGASTMAKLQLATATDMSYILTASGESSASGSSSNAGATAARFAGGGAVGDESAFAAIFPYAEEPFFVVGKGFETVEASELRAGPAGVVTASLTVMVQAGVDEGEKVFGNASLPGDLANELAAARSAQDPNEEDLAKTQDGRTLLYTVFIGGMLGASQASQ